MGPIIEWDKIELADSINDNDETLSFKTYKNYIVGLANLINKEYGFENSMPNIISNLNSRKKINRNISLDIDKVKSLLFNCWHTELNFMLPTTIGTSFMKYSIHWAPVQGYYALYLSIRSLLQSSNNEINHNHAQTLGAISNFLIERNLFPYPWKCFCSGLSELNNLNFNYFKREISEVSMLAIPTDETYESCYAKFLKTTRERQFKKRRENTNDVKTKKGAKKKSWSIKDKRGVEERIHKTTLFDCIYRLRIKSNYEDVDAFIFSNMTDSDVEEFYDSLSLIIESTLLIIEYLITSYLGRDQMHSIIDDFTNEIKKSEFRNKGIFIRKNYL